MSLTEIPIFLRLHAQDYTHMQDLCRALTRSQLWRSTPDGVSIGNYVAHVCEMERFWIDAGLGGEDFVRDRQQAFTRHDDADGEQLAQGLAQRQAATVARIEGLPAEEWARSRLFHGDQLTGRDILLWHVHHVGLHRGHVQAHARWLMQYTVN